MVRRDKHAEVRGGFTLMEVLVVVAIIVILAGAAVPLFMNRLEESKRRMAWVNARTIANAAETYKVNVGDYPTSLTELVTPPNGGSAYLEQTALFDPWGHQYQYAYPGQHNSSKPDVWSLGGRAGDPNGAVGNWMPSP
jgi:general secretion pathway protein G